MSFTIHPLQQIHSSIINWYPKFQKYTIRSIFIPLSQEYIKYLEDGIFCLITIIST